MHPLIFTTLFLIFAAACASPVHLNLWGSNKQSISEMTIDDVRNAYASHQWSVASAKWGGVVETILGGHQCQILKIEPSPSGVERDFKTEAIRLSSAGCIHEFAEEAGNSHPHYFVFKKNSFSRSPSRDAEMLKDMLKKAGDAFGEHWVQYLHGDDPESFVYHKGSINMAVFIGPPTKRDTTKPFEIGNERRNHLVGSYKRIADGPYGMVVEVSFDGKTGQVLGLESSSEPGFKTLLRYLYNVGSYMTLKSPHNTDLYYFFLEKDHFRPHPSWDRSPMTLKMREAAVKVYDSKKWERLKDGKSSAIFVYDRKAAVYLGLLYSAIVSSTEQRTKLVESVFPVSLH